MDAESRGILYLQSFFDSEIIFKMPLRIFNRLGGFLYLSHIFVISLLAPLSFHLYNFYIFLTHAHA